MSELIDKLRRWFRIKHLEAKSLDYAEHVEYCRLTMKSKRIRNAYVINSK